MQQPASDYESKSVFKALFSI